jgi:hypothetical protein
MEKRKISAPCPEDDSCILRALPSQTVEGAVVRVANKMALYGHTRAVNKKVRFSMQSHLFSDVIVTSSITF